MSFSFLINKPIDGPQYQTYTHPDYPAFLILQRVLTGSGGVNFLQRAEGEPAMQGSLLHGIGKGIATLFLPTADPYTFSITGRTDVSARTTEVEEDIEKPLKRLREHVLSEARIAEAKKRVLEELVFDLEPTEDAAHQMTYFEGIGAFTMLQELPQRIDRVTPEEVRRVAEKYLQSYQRTIGWYLADSSEKASTITTSAVSRGVVKIAPARALASETFLPRVKRLQNGMVLIARRIGRTPTGFLRILIPTNTVAVEAEYSPDSPVWGYTSLEWRFLKENLASTVARARKLWDSEFKKAETDPVHLDDPEFRLNYELERTLGLTPHPGDPLPSVIAIVGDLEETEAFALFEQSFGSLQAGRPRTKQRLAIGERQRSVRLARKAQSQFGYAVPAPPPSDPNRTRTGCCSIS